MCYTKNYKRHLSVERNIVQCARKSDVIIAALSEKKTVQHVQLLLPCTKFLRSNLGEKRENVN